MMLVNIVLLLSLFISVNCLDRITASGVRVQGTQLLLHDRPFFVNGINVPWNHYGDDFVVFNETYAEQLMKDVSLAGGNTIRWWIHAGGDSSPIFDNNGYVKGISKNLIPNLLATLAMAKQHNILVIFVLWNYMMVEKHKNMFEDVDILHSYFNNALISMVQACKGNVALLSWEIINEPEGMNPGVYGWTKNRVSFSHIQRFINHHAAYIHRNDMNVLVQTGAWSMVFMSNLPESEVNNIYTDRNLTVAGGMSDGTLDVYQVHTYNSYYNNWQSSAHPSIYPFDWEAAHWQLKKPIMFGEFAGKGDTGANNRGWYNGTQLYEIAYKKGYVGAMAWAYDLTNSSPTGGFVPDIRDALLHMSIKYAQNIKIILSSKQ